MPKPIISGTSCFIVLSNIRGLELLRKVYGQIITTPDVMLEYGQALPSIDKIRETDFYISNELYLKAIEEAGE